MFQTVCTSCHPCDVGKVQRGQSRSTRRRGRRGPRHGLYGPIGVLLCELKDQLGTNHTRGPVHGYDLRVGSRRCRRIGRSGSRRSSSSRRGHDFFESRVSKLLAVPMYLIGVMDRLKLVCGMDGVLGPNGAWNLPRNVPEGSKACVKVDPSRSGSGLFGEDSDSHFLVSVMVVLFERSKTIPATNDRDVPRNTFRYTSP